MLQTSIRHERWAYRKPFTISRHTLRKQDVIIVEICDGEFIGRGESSLLDYAGETVLSVLAQLRSLTKKFTEVPEPSEIQHLLPPGSARNALDCALWDILSKRSKKPAWKLAGFPMIKDLHTAYTLGINSPEEMQNEARLFADYPILKVKLKGDGADMDRLHAIRQGAPNVRLIVDANEGWGERQLLEYIPKMKTIGVELIEQPVRADEDEILRDFKSAIPLCADESCNVTSDLGRIVGKYSFINIKLDKTGGLTEALKLAKEAKRINLGLMVGSMVGTSLAMAPSAIIGQMCKYVDLDGPLLLAKDRKIPIEYKNGKMNLPEKGLWG